MNFPDGEVFTGPWRIWFEGWVSLPIRPSSAGMKCGVRLRFESGRVVEALPPSRAKAFLLGILNMDEDRAGWASCHRHQPSLTVSRATIFDEKIRGLATWHWANRSPAPAVNESGLHWDMVCDLRQDSHLCGRGVVYENGEFAVRFAELAGGAASDGGPYSMERNVPPPRAAT